MFNMKLPTEIIVKIINYLSMHDLVNCGIAKLFLPTILTLPCLVNNIYLYMLHTLCYHVSHLYGQFSIEPFILENQIYILVDLFKAVSNSMEINNSKIMSIIDRTFYHFASIFLPFHYYKREHGYTVTVPNCKDCLVCETFTFKLHSSQKLEPSHKYYQKQYDNLYKCLNVCKF